MTYTHDNTPGYTDAGLRALNQAHALLLQDRGIDGGDMPDALRSEIDANIRSVLTNTLCRNLSVRALVAIFNGGG